MDSIFLAIVVALFVWLFMRRRRKMQQQRAQAGQAQSGDGSVTATPQSMARIGRPGTITRDQMKALRDKDFEPSRVWSTEEGALILDSVTYLREAIREATGETQTPLEVQNKILAAILTDEELRMHIVDLRLNMTRDDEARGAPPLPHDEKFDRVMGIVRDLWDE